MDEAQEKGSANSMSPCSRIEGDDRNQKKVIIYGAGGHAKVLTEIIEKQGLFQLAGYVCTNPCGQEGFREYKVLGSEEELDTLITTYSIEGTLVGIGDNWKRWKIVKRVSERHLTLEFVTVIHPSAQIASDVEIGPGTVVMAGAVINPGTRIGCHCIINTGVLVDHDNTIGDFVTLAPGSMTGGEVVVGDFTAICLGAHVINKITIGEHCVIGAGATLLQNAPSLCTLYGCPAKPRRRRSKGEPYLSRGAWRSESEDE